MSNHPKVYVLEWQSDTVIGLSRYWSTLSKDLLTYKGIILWSQVYNSHAKPEDFSMAYKFIDTITNPLYQAVHGGLDHLINDGNDIPF